MGRGAGKGIVRARFVAVLAGLLLAGFAGSAAAEYPRKVAIASFTVLTSQEDLQKIAPILPRLLSSRLMALSGAEVLLLPSGETSPREAAVKAGYPLLLTGSVAKLGAGYSIDLTVNEIAGGKTAGAFFVAAETVDAIIPRLGDLAVDVVEKMFGVKAARPQAPAPFVQVPPPLVPAAPQQVVSVPPIPAAPGQAASAPVAAAPPSPAPAAAQENWVPSSLKKAGESGRIADELHGVVAGDVDEEGNGQVVAYGKKGIYLYDVKGTELLPHARITEGLPDHLFNVEAVDLDGDGKKEILVTGLEAEDLRSSVWRRKGDTYEKVAARIPYYLVLLPDWNGKPVVAGQQQGRNTPFFGKIYRMSWDGTSLAIDEALPADTLRAPLSSGVLGLSSAKFGQEWKLIYTDASDNLRVLDPSGNTEYKTAGTYGWSGDVYEWGQYLPRQGRSSQFVRKAARVTGGPDGYPFIVVPEDERGFLNLAASSKTTRLVLFAWEKGELVEKAGTAKSASASIFSGADFLSHSRLGRGGKVVASVIEQEDGIIKGGMSRLALFVVE